MLTTPNCKILYINQFKMLISININIKFDAEKNFLQIQLKKFTNETIFRFTSVCT